MTISDEQLMAYADGELPEEERAAVEAAIANDPALAEQVHAHRALRAQLAEAFSGTLVEPPPARFTELLASTPPSVISLDAHRESREQERARRRWSWPEWGALAASVVAGVAAGSMWLQGRGPIGSEGGALVARGEL
ncbi:anti-sigma factor, partial [Massilia arenosa]